MLVLFGCFCALDFVQFCFKKNTYLIPRLLPTVSLYLHLSKCFCFFLELPYCLNSFKIYIYKTDRTESTHKQTFILNTSTQLMNRVLQNKYFS